MSDKAKKRLKIYRYIFQILITLVLALYLGGLLSQIIKNVRPYQPNTDAPPIVIHFKPDSVFIDFLTSRLGIIVSFAAFVGFNVLIFMVERRIKAFKGITDKDRNFEYSDKGTYGTSSWMTEKEQRKVFKTYSSPKQTNETIVGKDRRGNIITLPYSNKINKHIAVYGASGTGKSRAFVRNYMLQAAARGESLVITDPKGELYESMAGYLESKGYDVKMFNLVNLEYSDAWNCLMEISGADQTTTAQIFADVIIQNTSAAKNAGDFWAQCEMNLCKALCLYVRQNPAFANNCTMAQVYNILTTTSPAQMDRMFSEIEYNDKTEASILAYNIFKQASDNVKGGVVIGLGSRLQVFQGSTVKKITSHYEIDLTKPGKEKCAYFCITSDQHSAFDFLAVLFYSMMFIKLVEYADSQPGCRCKVPVNFVLDEFPNIGAIPDFTKKISTIRSRDLNVCVIFQNIAQLQNRYPYGKWEEILGNCDTHIFLGCTDATTAEFISNKTGTATVMVQSQAEEKSLFSPIGGVEYKSTHSIGKRNLLTPDEVMRLPGDTELIFIRGQNPLRLYKYDYSLHPESKMLVNTPVNAHLPEWKKRELEAEAERKQREAEKNNATQGANALAQEATVAVPASNNNSESQKKSDENIKREQKPATGKKTDTKPSLKADVKVVKKPDGQPNGKPPGF